MAGSAAQPSHSVVCPHCRKEFEGELLVASENPGPRGYKCPHCRLFVPVERANPPDAS